MKIKIGVQYPHGACSYYRTLGVFSKLHKLNDKIKVELIKEIEWHMVANADILYLERPSNYDFHTACTIAKDFNIPLWLDYDDNLFDLPEYNPGYKYFSQKTTKEVIQKCLKLADIVTVTTPELQKVYSNYNNNVHIVENAFNDYNYQLENNYSKNESLFWRGSETHRNDLLGVGVQMFDLAEKYKKWGWCFVGNNVWFITDNMKNYYQIDELTVLKYFRFIKQTNAGIQLAPLAFNRFNVGKSNISWIEGTFAGSCCIAPNLPEWNRPGVTVYDNANDFKEKLENLIKDKKIREMNFKASRKYIIDNLMLSDINKKRLNIIERLK